MEPGMKEQNPVFKHEQYVFLSFIIIVILPQVVSLCFSFVCVLFIIFMLRELEWQSAFVEFIYFFVFLNCHLTPKPTHNIPPRESRKWCWFLLLPFSKPHWNEQLNPTDVSERPRSKPERRGGGGDIYIGDPSRLITDEPPSFSAKVCRSLRSSKPFTCHSCLIPSNFLLIASFELA